MGNVDYRMAETDERREIYELKAKLADDEQLTKY
jgi:hypothetical protein